MKSNQYDTELEYWDALQKLVQPDRTGRAQAPSELAELGLNPRQVQAAIVAHCNRPNANNWNWFSNFEAVSELVGLTSNEGWYSNATGHPLMKTLDSGHTASDVYESFAISLQKLWYDKEQQSVNYHAPWQHMAILPAEVGGSTRSLVGAHGRTLTEGTYMFVICEDGAIRYFPNDDSQCEEGGKHYVQYLPHAALAVRGAVLGAGNIGVDPEGCIVWAASNSGHYRVHGEMCIHNLLTALEGYGYDYRATIITAFLPDTHVAPIAPTPSSMEEGIKYFWFFEYAACGAFQLNRCAALGQPQFSATRPVRNPVVDQVKVTLRDLAAYVRES